MGRTQRATATGNVSKKGHSENNSETACRISFKFGIDVLLGGYLCFLSWLPQGRTQRVSPAGSVTKKGRPENNSATACRISFKFGTGVPSGG